MKRRNQRSSAKPQLPGAVIRPELGNGGRHEGIQQSGALAREWSVTSSSAEGGVFGHILAPSLFFKTPYVWDDRRPRPRLKERSPCRAVGHVHEWRLDAASYGGITAVLPV